MKRRDFLAVFSLGAIAVAAVTKASGILNKAMASADVWVKAGTLGYKEVAPDNQVKAGKQCKTCKHYEAKGADGICKLPAMKTAAKAAAAPMVKADGYCNMWAKKA